MGTQVWRFRITGMHCGSCGLLIDEALIDVPGVQSSRTDVRAGTTTVEVDAVCTPAAVTATIRDTGYEASHEARHEAGHDAESRSEMPA